MREWFYAWFGSLRRDAEDAHWRISRALSILIFTVMVMWGINVAGWMGVNYLLLLGAVVATVVWAYAPRRLLIAAGLGVLIEGLSDRDITQGAVRGVVVLHKVVMGVLLGVCVIAGLLATWSFEGAAMNFPPIALAAFTFGIMSEVYNTKTKWFRGLVAVYMATLAMNAFWGSGLEGIFDKMEEKTKAWWHADDLPRDGIPSKFFELAPGASQTVAHLPPRCLSDKEAGLVVQMGEGEFKVTNPTTKGLEFRYWVYDATEGKSCAQTAQLYKKTGKFL